MKKTRIQSNKIVLTAIAFALSLMLAGCYVDKLNKPLVKYDRCSGKRSSNKIVKVDGRTLLVYDKNLDKECINSSEANSR